MPLHFIFTSGKTTGQNKIPGVFEEEQCVFEEFTNLLLL